MLVIHPKDKTTAVLSTLYDGMEARVVNGNLSGNEMGHLLHHTSSQERIMLLGHGCDKGLFFRNDDTQEGFDRVIVGHPHAFHLRRHTGNLIGIWCHADKFARKEGLHGLFSGMIISDKYEAQEYGIITLQHHIDEVCSVMFARLRNLLDAGIPLREIPDKMKELDDRHSSLTSFNYGNFYYL